ncbi:MAG: hypothetical protein QXO51_05465 [Halobacteria archaeon]
MTSPVAAALGVAALAVSVAGSLLLSRIGKDPDLHKARLFLRFDELHRLHIASMAGSWLAIAGYAISAFTVGPPPLLPHGVMMLLMSAWGLFMAVSVTLLVKGRGSRSPADRP